MWCNSMLRILCLRIPYGQALFEGILTDSTSAEALEKIKATLKKNGRTFFNTAMDKHELDAILSINNYHASLCRSRQVSGLDGSYGL